MNDGSEEKCSFCKGTGIIGYWTEKDGTKVPQTCDFCNGSGKKECPYCMGTGGTIDPLSEKPKACGCRKSEK